MPYTGLSRGLYFLQDFTGDWTHSLGDCPMFHVISVQVRGEQFD